MPAKHHVYLIPGFFGFANLGELVYFGHARDFLKAEFARRGIDAQVVAVPSHPTASIRVRTCDLLQVIHDTAGADDGPIHLIGHSTGALDARLLLTPGVALGGAVDPEPYARRVRSMVGISAPHAGTPLATFFLGFFGQQLLKLLSLFTVYVLRFGRLPLSVAFHVGGVITRHDDKLGWRQTLLDQVFAELLADFSPERQAALARFFSEVGNDTSLIPQLTPEGAERFNASTPDRLGVRYGSIVTKASPPSLRARISAGLDPYAQLTHSVYSLLYRQTQRMPTQRLALHTPAQTAALVQAYGALPSARANDGIVPTRSQVYGRVLAAVRADHLDAIGHFDEPNTTPPHVDWLISGSGFRRFQFERMWRDITDFLFETA